MNHLVLKMHKIFHTDFIEQFLQKNFTTIFIKIVIKTHVSNLNNFQVKNCSFIFPSKGGTQM